MFVPPWYDTVGVGTKFVNVVPAAGFFGVLSTTSTELSSEKEREPELEPSSDASLLWENLFELRRRCWRLSTFLRRLLRLRVDESVRLVGRVLLSLVVFLAVVVAEFRVASFEELTPGVPPSFALLSLR